MMYNFSYFKCRLERCELGIGGTPSLQGKGALKDKVSESRFNDDSGYYWVELVSLINTHFFCSLIRDNTLYLSPGFRTINNMSNKKQAWAHSVSQT